MLLIISYEREPAEAVAELLYYTGILTDICTPVESPLIFGNCHRGILILGDALFDPDDSVVSIAREHRGIPIFAIGDGATSAGYPVDEGFAEGTYPCDVVRKMILLSQRRGLTPVGAYSLGDVSIERTGEVKYMGRHVRLTRTETAIMRYLVASYPEKRSSKDILCHSFRASRAPMLSSVRTHITSINRRFMREVGTRIIESDGGYRLSVGKNFRLLTEQLATESCI